MVGSNGKFAKLPSRNMLFWLRAAVRRCAAPGCDLNVRSADKPTDRGYRCELLFTNRLTTQMKLSERIATKWEPPASFVKRSAHPIDYPQDRYADDERWHNQKV